MVRRRVRAFSAKDFLDSTGVGKTVREYGRGESIFTQGDACEDVFYIQTGGVTLSVLSNTGRHAAMGTLGPSDFFGEACLAGQSVRSGSATAHMPSVIRLVGKKAMAQVLGKQHAMAGQFISYLLARSMWMEEALSAQIFRPAGL